MSSSGNDTGLVDTTRETARQLESLRGLSDRFGESLTRAFARGIAQGQELDGILRTLAAALSRWDCGVLSRRFNR